MRSIYLIPLFTFFCLSTQGNENPPMPAFNGQRVAFVMAGTRDSPSVLVHLTGGRYADDATVRVSAATRIDSVAPEAALMQELQFQMPGDKQGFLSLYPGPKAAALAEMLYPDFDELQNDAQSIAGIRYGGVPQGNAVRCIRDE